MNTYFKQNCYFIYGAILIIEQKQRISVIFLQIYFFLNILFFFNVAKPAVDNMLQPAADREYVERWANTT